LSNFFALAVALVNRLIQFGLQCLNATAQTLELGRLAIGAHDRGRSEHTCR